MILLICFPLCRPQDTHRGAEATKQADLNLLYWSSERCVVDADKICGHCTIRCGEDIDEDLDDWFSVSPDRFYFMEAYNSSNKTFDDPPHSARGGGPRGKGKGKGRSKGKLVTPPTDHLAKPTESSKEKEFKPLRSLDVFAGCGGYLYMRALCHT